MGSKRISNYTSKPSSCLIYVCCHGRLLIALNLASNFGRIIFGWVGPVLASKTSPAGPNYVDQTWSGRTDFFPGPIFSLQHTAAAASGTVRVRFPGLPQNRATQDTSRASHAIVAPLNPTQPTHRPTLNFSSNSFSNINRIFDCILELQSTAINRPSAPQTS